jgi:hypothetical protein
MEHSRREGDEIAWKIWSETLKGSEHFRDLGVVWRIILKWILRKYGVRVWTMLI